MPLRSPQFVEISLLLLRLMVGLVFASSGYSHLKDPDARSKSIGMPKSFTIFLGIGEVAGGLGVAFGVLTQIAAFGLILIMLGAIYKKIFACPHRILGRKGFRVELRIDARPDESGDRGNQRRRLRADEIVPPAFITKRPKRALSSPHSVATPQKRIPTPNPCSLPRQTTAGQGWGTRGFARIIELSRRRLARTHEKSGGTLHPDRRSVPDATARPAQNGQRPSPRGPR
jgi:uncharacterized membrane protein